MKWTSSVAISLSMFIAAARVPVAPDENELVKCVGLGTTTLERLAPCDEGCGYLEVSTPDGPGEACICNYIGPHPSCCRTARVVGTQEYSTSGDCAAPGCDQSGTCRLVAVIQNDLIVAYAALCL